MEIQTMGPEGEPLEPPIDDEAQGNFLDESSEDLEYQPVEDSEPTDEDSDEGLDESAEDSAEAPEQPSTEQMLIDLAGIENRRKLSESVIQERLGQLGVAEGEYDRIKELVSEAKSDKQSLDRELIDKAVQIAEAVGVPVETFVPEDARTQLPGTWQSLPTRELLTSNGRITGLSETKLAAICEQVPTVGALETIRGEASKEHRPFADLLPKGIGETVAGRIEERLIEWIAKCSQSQVAKELDQAGRDLANKLSDEIGAIIQNWNASDCKVDEFDNEGVHAGFNAFEDGADIYQIPSDDEAVARDWMTGFLSARRLKELSDK